MEKYGYELVMDTAIFWASRLEKNGDDGKYHVNDVVGPDEYREHVNDNAFTNYMAHWNMKKAMEYYHLLKEEKPEIFARLDNKLNLETAYAQWEDAFPPEVKKASWSYYEKRTLHDSSLSLSTHSVLASDMGEKKLAYDLFKQAAMIDLGSFMGSSNAGIHAASFGGVWECVVYGFGGVRMLDGKLRVNPSLPEAWNKLSYTMIWKGQKLTVEVTKDTLRIENLTGTSDVELEAAGKACVLGRDALTIML